MTFLGWKIVKSDWGGSQRWGAERFGVGMCCNTKEGLLEMIRQKALDEEARRSKLRD